MYSPRSVGSRDAAVAICISRVLTGFYVNLILGDWRYICSPRCVGSRDAAVA